jgi:ferredoxin
MVSMLHRLAKTERKVHFVHACEDGKVHAHRDEVLRLAKSVATVRTCFVYRTPSPEDLSERRCDSAGVVDRMLLQGLLPLDDYDFYLCGPPGFMKAVYGVLLTLGVPKARIKYEFFGPATILEPNAPAVEAHSDPAPQITDNSDTGGAEIIFASSGRMVRWGDFTGTLLEFAEQQGLTPEFSCRAGICNSCECDLLEGSVSYDEQPLDTPPEGKVLICLARPAGQRLRLDL